MSVDDELKSTNAATSAVLNSKTYWVFVDPDLVLWPTYHLYTRWCRTTVKPRPSKQDTIESFCADEGIVIPATVIARNYLHGWGGHAHETVEARDDMLYPAPAAGAPVAGAATGMGGLPGMGAGAAGVQAAGPTPAAYGTLAPMLTERKKQHGDFNDHATYSQCFKDVMRHAISDRIDRGQEPLSQTQLEGAEMILHKLARVLAGDPNHDDHWRDIAGYATITADRIVR